MTRLDHCPGSWRPRSRTTTRSVTVTSTASTAAMISVPSSPTRRASPCDGHRAERFTADYAFDWSRRQANNATAQLVHVRPLQIGLGGRFYQQLAAVSSPERMQQPLVGTAMTKTRPMSGSCADTGMAPGGGPVRESISSYRTGRKMSAAAVSAMYSSMPTRCSMAQAEHIPAGTRVANFYSTREDKQEQWSEELQLLVGLRKAADVYPRAYYFTEEGGSSTVDVRAACAVRVRQPAARDPAVPVPISPRRPRASARACASAIPYSATDG